MEYTHRGFEKTLNRSDLAQIPVFRRDVANRFLEFVNGRQSVPIHYKRRKYLVKVRQYPSRVGAFLGSPWKLLLMDAKIREGMRICLEPCGDGDNAYFVLHEESEYDTEPTHVSESTAFESGSTAIHSDIASDASSDATALQVLSWTASYFMHLETVLAS